MKSGKKKLEELELDDFGTREVRYVDPASRKIKPGYVTIWHDDVLTLTVKLMEKPKFRSILKNKYPIVLIDEYQDSNKEMIDSLNSYFLESGIPLIGYFGDPWQKIYDNVCGKISHPNIIQLRSNFRSVPEIVNFLNKIRPDLQQVASDPLKSGSVIILHTNNWTGVRLTKSPNKGDLPAEIVHEILEGLKKDLEGSSWNFSSENTKILMLTHNVLAVEQGYSNLLKVFRNKDMLFKKEDPYIKFFIEILEPVCKAYILKQFGEMFDIIGTRKLKIKNHADKQNWARDMDMLLRLRKEKCIGDVIDHIIQTEIPYLPEAIKIRAQQLQRYDQNPNDAEPTQINRLRQLRNVPYTEIIKVYDFIEEKSIFSTNHGVKGAEFENVLVVFL